MEQRFRRQAFYDLVWSEPLSALAPRFGISDVALAKICRRHGIPVPGRGYWAKLKAGKPSLRVPLSQRGLGAVETICIGHSDWNERQEEERALMTEDVPPPPEFTEPLPELIARVTKLVGYVPQSRSLKSPHRVITALLANDAERLEKWQQSSYPSLYDQPFYLAPYEQRRLKLVDAIFNAATRVGMAPSIPRQKNPGEFTVRVGDTAVSFTLGKPGEERSNWKATSEVRRPATEPIQLKIGRWSNALDGLVMEWTDSPEAALETSLLQIVVHLIVAAEMQVRINEHDWHEQRLRNKARLLEDEQKRQEEAVRRECERERRLETASIEKLFQDAMSLRLAEDIRSYVAVVNTRSAESLASVPEERIADWSRWALEQADRIDPVRTQAFLQPVSDPGEHKPSQDRHTRSPGPEPGSVPASWHPNRWYTRLRR